MDDRRKGRRHGPYWNWRFYYWRYTDEYNEEDDFVILFKFLMHACVVVLCIPTTPLTCVLCQSILSSTILPPARYIHHNSIPCCYVPRVHKFDPHNKKDKPNIVKDYSRHSQTRVQPQRT